MNWYELLFFVLGFGGWFICLELRRQGGFTLREHVTLFTLLYFAVFHWILPTERQAIFGVSGILVGAAVTFSWIAVSRKYCPRKV